MVTFMLLVIIVANVFIQRNPHTIKEKGISVAENVIVYIGQTCCQEKNSLLMEPAILNLKEN